MTANTASAAHSWAFPSCWVALNDLSVGLGRTVFAGPCDDDSNFSIPNVPDGNYNLTLFDANLTMVIGTQNVLKAATASGVERVLFTSSDKAVNPTSLMGASKRAAELLVLQAAG